MYVPVLYIEIVSSVKPQCKFNYTYEYLSLYTYKYVAVYIRTAWFAEG